jgi:SagB-type dehydrogenase family enzyme
LRRATCLVGTWAEREFALTNYVSGRGATVSAAVVELLSTLEVPATRAAIATCYPRVPGLDAILDRLGSADLVLSLGSSVEQRDAAVAKTWRWGHAARMFHFETRRVRFEEDVAREDAALIAHAREEAPPAPLLERGGDRATLPGGFAEMEGSLWNSLRSRRTVRAYRRTPLDLDRFARILLWTWGATRIVDDPPVGQHILRTSPSGGARHPIEVYPIVLRVEDLAPGVYHYRVADHALELLGTNADEALAIKLCASQAWVGDAAAVFVMTAVLARSMWKYSQDHAYRVVHLDAGHLGQTFHLVCTALGLAPFTTGALDHAAIESALDIDGISEVPLYAGAVGLPRPAPSEEWTS